MTSRRNPLSPSMRCDCLCSAQPTFTGFMFTTCRNTFGPGFGTRNIPLQYAISETSHQAIAPVATNLSASWSIQRLCSFDFASADPHLTALTSKPTSTGAQRPSRSIDTHIGDAPISCHARQQRCGPPTTGRRAGGNVAHTHESTAWP